MNVINITAPALCVTQADALFPSSFDDSDDEVLTASLDAIAFGAEVIEKTLGVEGAIHDPDSIKIESIDAPAYDKALDILGLANVGTIDYQVGEVRVRVQFICQT